jgi:hypothetical protein
MRRNRTGGRSPPRPPVEGPASLWSGPACGKSGNRPRSAPRQAAAAGSVARRRPGSVDDRRCLLRGGIAVVRADRPRRSGSARDDPGRLRRRPCCGHASRQPPLRPARSPPCPAPRGRAPRRADRWPRDPGHTPSALARHARTLLALAGACQGTFVPGSYVLMPAIAPGYRLQRATPHSSAPSSPAAAFALDAATFAISALTPRVAAAGRRPVAGTAHCAEAAVTGKSAQIRYPFMAGHGSHRSALGTLSGHAPYSFST